jgi:hypothetical protein
VTGYHLRCYFTVGCPLRGSGGEYLKRASSPQKTIKGKKFLSNSHKFLSTYCILCVQDINRKITSAMMGGGGGYQPILLGNKGEKRRQIRIKRRKKK